MSEPTSPYLSLRQAVQPAIAAHRLLAGEQERAGALAAECEDLLFLTRELLKAAGRARILGDAPGPVADAATGSETDGSTAGSAVADVPRAREAPAPGGAGAAAGGDRQGQLLDAYADAGLLWAKVVGSSVALAGSLVDRGDWDDAGRLADFLAGAGEASAAADIRIQLGNAVWAAHRGVLKGIGNAMPVTAIEAAIGALRAVLRAVPEDFPDRNREVNRFLPPLAASIHAIMKARGVDIPYSSRVEHIAGGGVARYPDIVTMSLDELAAEFEGLCR